MKSSAAVADPLSRRRGLEVGRLGELLRTLAESSWFAYCSIFILQLRVVWGMWSVRDLTFGDTASYFTDAAHWVKFGQAPISWSPVYTGFYAILWAISHEPFWATTAHRLIVVMVLSVLVLAVMRSLLPASIAWLMSAWWVVQPTNFNATYEVHLFGLLPALLAVLAIRWKTGARGRGLAIAILLFGSVLVRNELAIGTFLLAMISVAWEIRQARRGNGLDARSAALAYGAPLAVVALIVAGFVARASDLPQLSLYLRAKHTLNVCQIYAFGYQERNTDWLGNPWLDCRQLMQRDFHDPQPTMLGAIERNPSAMLSHFLWNVRLIPDGVEVLLFGACYGSVSPDYLQTTTGALAPLVVGLLLVLVVATGYLRLWASRREWGSEWAGATGWSWAALLCLCAGVVVVIVTQRPRPEYAFILGITLRAMTGVSLLALMGSRLVRDWVSLTLPVIAAAACLFVPSFYLSQPSPDRSLLSDYTEFVPYKALLTAPGTVFLATSYASELCAYLGAAEPCSGEYFYPLRRNLTTVTSLAAVAEARRVNLVLVDGSVLSDPLERTFVLALARAGWHSIKIDDSRYLLSRSGARSMAKFTSQSLLPVRFGWGWYESETVNGAPFQWAQNDADISVSTSRTKHTLDVDVLAGPSIAVVPARLEIQSHASGQWKDVETVDFAGRETITIPLAPQATTEIRLHVVGKADAPAPGDARTLTLGLFSATVR